MISVAVTERTEIAKTGSTMHRDSSHWIIARVQMLDQNGELLTNLFRLVSVVDSLECLEKIIDCETDARSARMLRLRLTVWLSRTSVGEHRCLSRRRDFAATRANTEGMARRCIDRATNRFARWSNLTSRTNAWARRPVPLSSPTVDDVELDLQRGQIREITQSPYTVDAQLVIGVREEAEQSIKNATVE
jgi:hypothetical protein